jgi:hypothetical protein
MTRPDVPVNLSTSGHRPDQVQDPVPQTGNDRKTLLSSADWVQMDQPQYGASWCALELKASQVVRFFISESPPSSTQSSSSSPPTPKDAESHERSFAPSRPAENFSLQNPIPPEYRIGDAEKVERIFASTLTELPPPSSSSAPPPSATNLPLPPPSAFEPAEECPFTKAVAADDPDQLMQLITTRFRDLNSVHGVICKYNLSLTEWAAVHGSVKVLKWLNENRALFEYSNGNKEKLIRVFIEVAKQNDSTLDLTPYSPMHAAMKLLAEQHFVRFSMLQSELRWRRATPELIALLGFRE